MLQQRFPYRRRIHANWNSAMNIALSIALPLHERSVDNLRLSPNVDFYDLDGRTNQFGHQRICLGHKPTESLFLGTPFTLRVRIRWYSPPTRGRYALHVGKIRPDLDGSVRRPRLLCAHHPPLKMLGSCSSEFYGWLSLPSWRLESTIRCRSLVFLSKMPLLLTMSSCRLSFCAALRRL